MNQDEVTRLCTHEDSALCGFLTGLTTGSSGRDRRPKSYETLKSYRGTLDRLYRWKTTDWADVTTEQLWEFINSPNAVTGEPVSPNSVCQRRSAVVQFFHWAERKGVVPVDPTLDLGSPGQAETDREPVSNDDWRLIMASPLCPDDRLGLGLGYYTGLRRNEIVTLAPTAVNPLLEKIMFIRRKGGKTKKGLEYGALVRTLQQGLPHLAEGTDEWIDILESYARLRANEQFLLPMSQGVYGDGQRFRDRMEHHILPGAGIDGRKFSPHALRHSFATNMIACGMPIELLADAMSHASIETTRGYVDMTNQVDAWYRRVNKAPTGPTAASGRLRAVES